MERILENTKILTAVEGLFNIIHKTGESIVELALTVSDVTDSKTRGTNSFSDSSKVDIKT